jgi:formylmethanofuran dehydrogenase subunit E
MSFGDPLDDFNRRDAEYAEWLKTLPKCDICGEPIQDEYYYEINGDKICPECLEDFKKYND